MYCAGVFFFKQKTAYEMRISDWSSDVCSSDLDIEQNYHAASPGQRFAYDLVKRVGGSSHRGDGKALEDYYCWNAKILAPADGVVLEAVAGLPAQAIGTSNTAAVAGNPVLLDLGHGAYAMLAHLRRCRVAGAIGNASRRET